MNNNQYDIIPDELLKKGYSLEHLGILEYAWKKKEIEKILFILKENKIAVLGGDVYRLNKNKVESTYDGWFLQKDGSSEFMERSMEKVLTYINEYECRNGENFLYVLVY